MLGILFPVLLGINLDASHHFIAVAARPPRKEKVATGEGGGWRRGGGPTSYPPCNHVGVQLRSEGGVPIGNDSAAKDLTLWAKSEGGPEGPPQVGGVGGA